MTKSRTIPTYYEDELGDEHIISVEVGADGLRDIEIRSELPAMPDSEEQRLTERVAELYWAAERENYVDHAEGLGDYLYDQQKDAELMRGRS